MKPPFESVYLVIIGLHEDLYSMIELRINNLPNVIHIAYIKL